VLAFYSNFNIQMQSANTMDIGYAHPR